MYITAAGSPVTPAKENVAHNGLIRRKAKAHTLSRPRLIGEHSSRLEGWDIKFQQVRHELGPVAVIGELNFLDMLPKTRSGKIMLRVLKAVTQEKNPGDIRTIEDEGSVEEARRAWHQMRTALENQLLPAGLSKDK